MHDVFFQNLFKAFVAIDPLSLIPLFVVLTTNLNLKKTLTLSFLVFIITSSVLTFFSIFGNKFLLFMGVSINSFQIIGGVFLLFISYEMVFEKRIKRKKNAAEKILDENQIKNVAVFPVSIPLVAGPSAITLSVLISKNFNYSILDFYQKILPLIIILFLTSLIILFSNYIISLLNRTFLIILQKIFGLILGALSVEFITIGIKGIL
ncbi:MAG: antibiotic resistance protein MarC [Alphaproteobacteria bacterium]|nr:antibiotic resistance protein MarC [Alphaproteobacteria bacterium]|tara:strand:- start:170 stop:790 length:621 start_codon:yes stop_codon:yes gene_type:complete